MMLSGGGGVSQRTKYHLVIYETRFMLVIGIEFMRIEGDDIPCIISNKKLSVIPKECVVVGKSSYELINP